MFCEFLYAKASRVLADKCPRTLYADTDWNCYPDDCEYMYHRREGGRGEYNEANFNIADDYEFLEGMERERRRYNRLATTMKNEFIKHGADDAAVTKAIHNLNNLPEDATLEDKAKEFSATGFKITGMKSRKNTK